MPARKACVVSGQACPETALCKKNFRIEMGGEGSVRPRFEMPHDVHKLKKPKGRNKSCVNTDSLSALRDLGMYSVPSVHGLRYAPPMANIFRSFRASFRNLDAGADGAFPSHLELNDDALTAFPWVNYRLISQRYSGFHQLLPNGFSQSSLNGPLATGFHLAGDPNRHLERVQPDYSISLRRG